MTPFLHKKAAAASLLLALIFAGTLPALARVFDGGNPTAGVNISNHAEAIYTDEAGTSFSTISPTITVTVLAVSTLTVTPDETQASATVGANETLTRVFRVCNTGNTPDLYTITRAEVNTPSTLGNLYFDTDGSGTITSSDVALTINQSLSPRVGPGTCINV